ncbi:glycosyltransferase family 2 protein [Microbulbifer spongiae]|uniref:Glycosyltransferase n=1 Tax=Microbulbifer spongiae TaxID=2944933 RepID=A0ABY9EEJ5_9GAMM|nr:glycosyltransferase [Microbulbifer sp. MI-G]WKD51458.1 glycosyltransferase [Microbulbifer sp. MI-G]
MYLSFTVVIPIYEQWHFIPELLECLSVQTYRAGLVEILLIDNGSTQVCIPKEIPDNVKILYCNTRGSYAARNCGLHYARGEWIFFTDADCLPSENWFEEVVKKIYSTKLNDFFIAGRVDSISERKKPTAYEIYDIVKGIPQEHYVRRGYAATANLVVPRKLIKKISGFNERLYSGGDADFCRRARQNNFKIVYAHSALIRHRTRSSWEEIATKARRVKGGQLVCKSLKYKIWIFFRTFLSPIITIFRLLKKNQFTVKYRLLAAWVYLRVWVAELMEMFRVMLGGKPEHR